MVWQHSSSPILWNTVFWPALIQRVSSVPTWLCQPIRTRRLIRDATRGSMATRLTWISQKCEQSRTRILFNFDGWTFKRTASVSHNNGHVSWSLCLQFLSSEQYRRRWIIKGVNNNSLCIVYANKQPFRYSLFSSPLDIRMDLEPRTVLRVELGIPSTMTLNECVLLGLYVDRLAHVSLVVPDHDVAFHLANGNGTILFYQSTLNCC